jgi:hypothetical protein
MRTIRAQGTQANLSDRILLQSPHSVTHGNPPSTLPGRILEPTQVAPLFFGKPYRVALFEPIQGVMECKALFPIPPSQDVQFQLSLLRLVYPGCEAFPQVAELEQLRNPADATAARP